MPTITCDEDHKYKVDGVPKPGVTEILDSVLGAPYYPEGDHLLRGTYVHEACALDDEGKLDASALDSLHENYMGPGIVNRVLAFREFRNTVGWKTELREEMVYHPDGYCGRFDFLGQMPIRGKRVYVLLDLKSGQPLKRVRLQLSLYRRALSRELHCGLEPVRASLWLKDDVTYKLDVYDQPEHRRDDDSARTVLAAYHIKKEFAQ